MMVTYLASPFFFLQQGHLLLHSYSCIYVVIQYYIRIIPILIIKALVLFVLLQRSYVKITHRSYDQRTLTYTIYNVFIRPTTQ